MLRLNFKFNNRTDRIGKKYVTHFLFLTMLEIERKTMEKAPTHEGMLKNSFFLEPRETGSTKYILYSDKVYARAMEFGTEPPHPMPAEAIENLKRWARLKLGDESLAYPIAWNIRQNGLTAQPYLRPALNEVKTNELPRIKERTNRAFKRQSL